MDNSAADQHKAHVASIAAAYLGNPSVRIEKQEVADVIRQIDAALKGGGTIAGTDLAPAMPSPQEIRKSVNPDFLVSFIDGKQYKTLRRHLTQHGHTPESYRERYGLKSEYPMVAANYSAQRSELAKRLGLGQMRARSVGATEAQDAPPPVLTVPQSGSAEEDAVSSGAPTSRPDGKRSKATAIDRVAVTAASTETAPSPGRARRGLAKARESQAEAVTEPNKPGRTPRVKAGTAIVSPGTSETSKKPRGKSKST